MFDLKFIVIFFKILMGCFCCNKLLTYLFLALKLIKLHLFQLFQENLQVNDDKWVFSTVCIYLQFSCFRWIFEPLLPAASKYLLDDKGLRTVT